MNITTVAIPSVIFVVLLLTGMGIFAICRKYVNLNLFHFSLIICVNSWLVDSSQHSHISILGGREEGFVWAHSLKTHGLPNLPITVREDSSKTVVSHVICRTPGSAGVKKRGKLPFNSFSFFFLFFSPKPHPREGVPSPTWMDLFYLGTYFYRQIQRCFFHQVE